VDPEELRALGIQAVLANTYHLHLRPGEEVVAQLGGLHRFMAWERPILTDSGGFQLFSLDHLCECTEEGVRFRSPIDGSVHFLSPEECIVIQERLGADMIVTLDQFEPIRSPEVGPDRSRARALAERTLRWAERCRAAQTRGDQLLFGIAQGGGFADLRCESARRTAELGFRAFAIGGLGIGEPPELRGELVEAALSGFPEPEPRYLMGIGMPEDLVAAVAQGLDLFDCVVPTRHARHGSVFTRRGRVQIRNQAHRDDSSPLDPDCACGVCRRFSRAYLRHLVVSKEMLGPRLLTVHNLAYFMNLFSQIRSSIAEDRFTEWARSWTAVYEESGSSSATHSAA
jgi:queuine tRNA-ribosyltransferase